MTASDDELTFISYADFGQRFFESAVTEERVLQAAGNLAGRPIQFGPTGVGPIGLVKVSAEGAVGQPTVQRRVSEHVAFDLSLPVDLQLLIEIGLEKYRFTAAMTLHLGVVARAAEPLKIVIHVEPPTKDTIDVDLQADGLRASVVQVIGGVEGELKRSVVKFVRREIDKPEMQAGRIIDVEKSLASLGKPVKG